MEWIKVADELPPENEDVYLKFKGHKYVGYYESKYKTFRGDGHQIFDEKIFNEVFWLKENNTVGTQCGFVTVNNKTN